MVYWNLMNDGESHHTVHVNIDQTFNMMTGLDIVERKIHKTVAPVLLDQNYYDKIRIKTKTKRVSPKFKPGIIFFLLLG